MDNNVVRISLWGEDIAAAMWNKERDCAVIEFNNSLVSRNLNVSPLMMPIDRINSGQATYMFAETRNRTHHGLPGLIADSLPDAFGNSIINEWLNEQKIDVETFTPIDRLCYVGIRGMGALEYKPAVNPRSLEISSDIEINELAKFANDILNDRISFEENLIKDQRTFQDILKVGTSAGGARPKAIIALNETMMSVRSGQVQAPKGYTYWLLKFDGSNDSKVHDHPRGFGRIEYAYHRMALDCKINMTECRLLEEGDAAHFMTKRFDRDDSGEKLHVQTLSAIAHFDRENRHSYEQAFQIMRRMHLPYPDQEELYRRMIFNVITRNQDDHTKNHSFVMDRSGVWRLAPAYDICYSFDPSGRFTRQHQMSLNNKRSNFTEGDFWALAQEAGIKDAKHIVNEIKEVVSKWNAYALEAGVKPEFSKQIENNLLLFMK